LAGGDGETREKLFVLLLPSPSPPKPTSTPAREHPNPNHSRALSQRVAVYSRRIVGETDALREEVRSSIQCVEELRRRAAKAAESADGGDEDSATSASAQPPPPPASPSTADGTSTLDPTPPGTRVAAVLREAQAVLAGKGPGGDLRRLNRPRVPLLLRLLMGSKLEWVMLRRDQAVAFKEEYYAFRNRSALLMAIVPLLLYLGMRRADAVLSVSSGGGSGSYGSSNQPHHLLRSSEWALAPRVLLMWWGQRGLPAVLEAAPYTLTPPLMTGLQGYLVWLAYFYTSMALRECVLLVNGSAIRAWWIQHHCWSAAGALLMLSLPVDSVVLRRGAEGFLLYCAAQAGVMTLQNRYQRRRMYVRIALGKNSAMDVVSGESSGTSGQLLFLYPMLFGLQLWQLRMGLSMVGETWRALLLDREGWLDPEPADADLRGARGTCILGALFAYLGVMNFVNTIITIAEKRRYRTSQSRASRRASSVAAAATAAGAAGAE
jgi:hypothetical protein